MTDIVKRLNRGEGCLDEGGKTCISMDAESGCICAIAADTILALRAENEKLRAALEKIVAMDEVALIEWKKGDGWLHQRVARAAITQETRDE